MIRDKEEAESLRLAKEAEEEKAMYSVGFLRIGLNYFCSLL